MSRTRVTRVCTGPDRGRWCRSRRAVVALAVAAAAAGNLAACSGGSAVDPPGHGDPTGATTVPEPAADTGSEGNTDDDAGNDGPADDAGNDGPADGDGGAEPGVVVPGTVIDLGRVQARHESGVVITMERLVVEASYVVLEFTAANGSTDEVALAGDTRGGLVLAVDDPSVVMTYQAPRVNETLELSSGEVLEGEIVFLGVLPSDVRSMDITFNPEPDPDGEVAEPTIALIAVPLVTGSGGG